MAISSHCYRRPRQLEVLWNGLAGLFSFEKTAPLSVTAFLLLRAPCFVACSPTPFVPTFLATADALGLKASRPLPRCRELCTRREEMVGVKRAAAAGRRPSSTSSSSSHLNSAGETGAGSKRARLTSSKQAGGSARRGATNVQEKASTINEKGLTNVSFRLGANKWFSPSLTQRHCSCEVPSSSV